MSFLLRRIIMGLHRGGGDGRKRFHIENSCRIYWAAMSISSPSTHGTTPSTSPIRSGYCTIISNSTCPNPSCSSGNSSSESGGGSSSIPSSITGGGNRIFTRGSGIGSDPSMIAANDRIPQVLVPFLREDGISSSKNHWTPSILARNHILKRFVSTMISPARTPSNEDDNENCDSKKNTSDKNNQYDGQGKTMEDEYGEMTAAGYTYVYPGPFILESGQILPKAELRYMTYGTLNHNRDNVLVVCHALTGNASLHTWWGDMLGPGKAFDTDQYFIVCANILGSCYGSTGPASFVEHLPEQVVRKESEAEEKKEAKTCSNNHSKTMMKYGMKFPDVSVQDTVRLQLQMIRDELQVNSIKCVIGGSFGGMQAVEYAVQAGKANSPFATRDEATGRRIPFVRSVIPIACGAAHTAWQIAVSEVQRQAIYADPKWNDGNPSMDDPPIGGLSVARQIGMISYRTPKAYELKFGRQIQTQTTANLTSDIPYGSSANWQVKNYLEYQGYKFLSRFDPVTYIKLTEQMDSHDIGRNRGGKRSALADVNIPALVMGIESDVLYPLFEQEELVSLFPKGVLKVIHSDAGHDGFLLEQKQVAGHITEFLESHGVTLNKQ